MAAAEDTGVGRASELAFLWGESWAVGTIERVVDVLLVLGSKIVFAGARVDPTLPVAAIATFGFVVLGTNTGFTINFVGRFDGVALGVPALLLVVKVALLTATGLPAGFKLAVAMTGFRVGSVFKIFETGGNGADSAGAGAKCGSPEVAEPMVATLGILQRYLFQEP